jgi:hypothetical protein
MPLMSGKVEILLYLELFELLVIITAVPGVIRCHGYLEK